jgi:Family of unknown function (DUF5683)
VTGKNKAYSIFIYLLLLLLVTDILYAAELPRDTLKSTGKNHPLEKGTVSASEIRPVSHDTAEVHSPRKASMFSACLPGLGQAYNKKYWKIPIVYGGFATLGYFIKWNNKNYKIANQAYKDLTDKDPATDSYMKLKEIKYFNLDNPSDVSQLKQGLITNQDYYRRNRDLLIIITVVFYGLNIIDASVDAHFYHFDISDDLTMQIRPVIMQHKNQNIFCLNCTFNF